MSEKFKNKYRIQSARAQWWDYGWNASYFVTLCTAHREHFFGEIVNGEMELSAIGELAQKFWQSIPEHFSFVQLNAFVIMPNHIHGILTLNKGHVETGHVETGHCPVSTIETNTGLKTPGENRFRNQGKETLSAIVGSFKSVVTKNAHRIHADFEWQERFHDHIIRDEAEYNKISTYIKNNVTNWHNDMFF